MQTKGTIFYSKKTLCLRGNLMTLNSPLVMGILNVTPDSFYDGGKHHLADQILPKASQLIKEGASILDIGGYSSRPNADDISIDEEISRVIPAIENIVKAHPQVVISIDTFRSKVAQEAVKAGAHIINDISGGNLDPEMFNTVAQLQVPYILMHMRGTPQTMTTLNNYEHLVFEIMQDLRQKITELYALGVHDLIIDPGFGFAKNINQNFHLLNHFHLLQALGFPLLAGISRKSMVYKTLQSNPQEALNGTTALHIIALQNGANILRVHDVKAAVEAIQLVEKLHSQQLEIN